MTPNPAFGQLGLLQHVASRGRIAVGDVATRIGREKSRSVDLSEDRRGAESFGGHL
jgi:hypothetical protein